MSDHDSGEAVIAILEAESQLSRRMLRVAEAKREALISADLETLAPLVRELEDLTTALSRLEHDRIAHARAAAGDPVGPELDCATLAERLGGAAGARLVALRDELRESLAELKGVNAGNACLVQQALVSNERLLKLVRGAATSTYAPSGAAVEAPLLRRAWSA